MAEEGADEANNLEALKRSMQYALIKNCDMNEEMRSDCVDAVISAAEKCAAVAAARAPSAEAEYLRGARRGIFARARGAGLAAAP